MNTPDRALRADAQRNRESVLDAASEMFASRGDDVQMGEIAERAGVGVGTLYRHFADKSALRAAIIGRRFQAMSSLARAAEESEEPMRAFEALLYGYLEAVQGDAAFRVSILGPEEPSWQDISSEKAEFGQIIARIVKRVVSAGLLRPDFDADDFIIVTRGAMANMDGNDSWRRHLELMLEGIRN